MDRTICCLRKVVCVAASQQIIFNAAVPFSREQSVLSVVQHRSHAVDGRRRFRCSLLSPFREQSNVQFDVPVTRELTAVFQGAVKVGLAPIFRIVRE